MKGFLLDTHVLLWWLAEARRLSPAARQVMKNPASELFLSAGAIWEMTIKKAQRRLECPDDLLAVLVAERITPLAITAEHALAVADLPLHHGDPFDRIQIAQALVEGLTLVTRDVAIRQYSVPLLIA